MISRYYQGVCSAGVGGTDKFSAKKEEQSFKCRPGMGINHFGRAQERFQDITKEGARRGEGAQTSFQQKMENENP